MIIFFSDGSADFASWIKRGANYNEWKLDPFVHEVKRQYETANLDYIFLDYPFAHLNDGIKDMLDLAIYIVLHSISRWQGE